MGILSNLNIKNTIANQFDACNMDAILIFFSGICFVFAQHYYIVSKMQKFYI
jgi:hypothetical protein